MDFKRLVIAGFTAMLPLGLVVIPTDKAQSQASCRNIQDSNTYPAPPYYYDPNLGIGCSPDYGGTWHRYNGTPDFGRIWSSAGGIDFRGYPCEGFCRSFRGYYIVFPVRVSIRTH